MGVPLKFFIMILIALICTRIPLSPDNFIKLTKCQTFQTPILVILNQWQTFSSHVRLILSRNPYKVIRL